MFLAAPRVVMVERYDSLQNQVALVTGANRGIGSETAKGLAELDATVYGGVRDTGHDVPEGVRPVELDVTDEGSIEAAVEEIVAEAGGLDVLVNNAGIGGAGETLDAAPTDEIDAILDTNLRGPMLLCKHAIPHLEAAENGRVVNVSSGLGALSEPIEGDHPAYRVSKAGLNGLTVSLDVSHDLLVNSVDPGWVATDLGGEQAPRSPEKGAETSVWLATFAEGAPSGYFWKDEERIEF